jgi:hypothetical protein
VVRDHIAVGCVGSDRIGLGLATSRPWSGGTICISMKVVLDRVSS